MKLSQLTKETKCLKNKVKVLLQNEVEFLKGKDEAKIELGGLDLNAADNVILRILSKNVKVMQQKKFQEYSFAFFFEQH